MNKPKEPKLTTEFQELKEWHEKNKLEAQDKWYSRGFRDGRVGLIEEIEKDLKERMIKLYCTADELGYHDKNCEGFPCEKAIIQDFLEDLAKLKQTIK